MQRPWNRRRRQGQHIHVRLQLLDLFLMGHAKALLLIDHQKSKILILHILVKARGVSRSRYPPDPFSDPRSVFFCCAGVRNRRHQINPYRKILHPLHKRIVMLLRQNRRRHQINHLLAVLHRLKRRADCNLRLAIANVPADQAIHDLAALHVPFRTPSIAISWSSVSSNGNISSNSRCQTVSSPIKRSLLSVLTRRIQLHQILCDLIHCRPDTGLGPVPLLRSELV